MDKGQTVRLRKNLSSLIGTNERSRYMICLKMIGILPAFQDLAEWEYYGLYVNFRQQGVQVKPKSLHDVLIASHSTSCDHHSIYFGYYHRHIMILFEIFINFAHQILTKGFQNLNKVYPKQKYPHLYDNTFVKPNQNLFEDWKNLFTYYAQINDGSLPKQISAHYWNATNYLNADDILIPIQLRDPRISERKIDSIDELFHKIKGSYPWEVNVADRWRSNGRDSTIKITLQAIIVQFKFYINDKKLRKQDQVVQKIKSGQMNPRNYKQIFKSLALDGDITLFNDYYKKYLLQSSSDVYAKILKYYKQSGDNTSFPVCVMQDKQVIINYGGNLTYDKVKYQYQYLKPDETLLYRGGTNQYNQASPHYTNARALFTSKDFLHFIDGSNPLFEKSHDLLHDKLNTIFSDGNYSISNLAFFPYHSWIDLALEFKVRQSNSNNQQLQTYKQLLGKYNIQRNGDLLSNFVQNQSFVKLLKDKKILDNKTDKMTNGDYPVLQYISPKIKKERRKSQQKSVSVSDIHLSVAFTQINYTMTSDKSSLTTTKDLNEVYIPYKQRFISTRFKKFTDFINFKFSYDYQVPGIEVSVIQDNANKNVIVSQILANDGTNIPKYLQDIKLNLSGDDKSALEAIESRSIRKIPLEIPKVRPFIQRRLLGSAQNQPEAKFGQGEEVIEKLTLSSKKQPDQQLLDLKNVFKGTLLGHIRYKSQIKNNFYPLKVTIDNLLPKLFQCQKTQKFLLEGKQMQSIESMIKNGLFLKYYSIFGKQTGSQSCANCTEYKDAFVELDDGLKETSPLIWQIVHLKSLNKLVYSSQEEVEVHCIRQQMRTVPVQGFETFQLIAGTEEISIQAVPIITSKIASCSLRIEAFSYSGLTGNLKTINSKQQKTLDNAKFLFYKSHNVDLQQKRNITDRYYYKYVRVILEINLQQKGTYSKTFEFNIPCFQRLVRLQLVIEEVAQPVGNEDAFVFRVVDIDYNTKEHFYSRFHEQIQQIKE